MEHIFGRAGILLYHGEKVSCTSKHDVIPMSRLQPQEVKVNPALSLFVGD